MKENTKRILIGISTIILIIIMVIYVDFREIQENLIKISIYGIILFILIYTLSFIFRTFRLRLIFRGLNLKTAYLSLYASFGIGWGINEITPGKVGDLARIEYIHQKENISISKSICGVTIERFIDLIIIFLFTCLTLFFLYFFNVKGTTDLNLHFYVGIGAFLLIGSVIVLTILFFKTDLILNLIGKISMRLRNRLKSFLYRFLEGMNDFRKDKKRVFGATILSIPIWFFDTFTLVLLFYLVGYEIDIFIIILAQIIIFFTKIFPITPGGWVISENIGALLIFLFYPSIPYGSILSIFILDHAIRTVYVLTYGISSTLVMNYKIKELDFNQLNNNEKNSELV